MYQFAEFSSLKPFPPAKLNSLLEDLERFRPKGRAVAAFDADGTLWNTDMGEAFFDYQIQNKLVPLPEDPFGHYHWMKANVSTTAAYVWLAQVLKGVPLEKVREWAETCVNRSPIPIFNETTAILKKLKELEVEVYIVTASITWAVEPGARKLGLPDGSVIGIETEVVNGVVTETPHGVVTYRQGKIEAILRKTGGLRPYFCAGNTEGDKWLLEGSSNLRLVLSAAPEGSENYPTENKMLAQAQDEGWHWHRYL